MSYTPYKESQGYHNFPFKPFEEYAPRYKDHFMLEKTDDGILIIKWHTNGHSAEWHPTLHRGIAQLFRDVGQDPTIECVIFGGYGENYLGNFAPLDEPREAVMSAYERYDLEYYDGTRSVESVVNIEQPTIGVINGPGYHTEYPVLCDLTLISDTAKISDMHYYMNAVGGDGVQIAWRDAMGRKRYNYALITNQIFTPEMAVQYGLANEVVEHDKIYDRALEIAREIMRVGKVARMVNTQVMRTPLKVATAWELRGAFASECFASTADDFIPPETSGEGNAVANKWIDYMKEIGITLYDKDGNPTKLSK